MQYTLMVRCEIRSTDDQGYSTGQGLTVQEDMKLEARSFMEVASILGRFHELSEKIKGVKP